MLIIIDAFFFFQAVIKAALIYHCHTLIGFMESDVTHVQCWVFNVMAMLVDDGELM